MVSGSNLTGSLDGHYDPEVFNPDFRFNEINFDFLQLNSRDFSLVEQAIGLGSNFQLIQQVKEIVLLKKENDRLNGLIDELAIDNKRLSGRYGRAPWSGERA